MKILEPLGYTPEHLSAVDAMDKNFTGSQFDYATASTKDMVDRASNPLTSVVSAIGNVVGRPAYDFVDAAQKYSDKGYQGEFGFTPTGIVDFGKNMLSLGGEFLDQKPGIMMAGALKGGIESLGTQLGEGIYGLMNKFKQQQFMNTQKQTMQEIIRQAEIEQKRKEAAAAHSARQQSTPGYGSDPGGKKSVDTSGKRGPKGKEMMADGGLINLYRYGGFI